ncbi:hypothetical protein [Sphingobium estronivorans]|uniref:hypothetical protein n=1 Tax=Sphingobium estronivorans TaxID=1577690 RepID=UPI00123BE913|nr:hypothetical protein [Sphingobium estronivorans]
MAVTGWKVDPADRTRLLELFPPAWPDVIADHVTLDAGATERTPLPPASVGKIVGHVDDGLGLQVLVVAVDGTTDRPDGSTYHISWSLDRARDCKPVESNEVIARLGFELLDQSLPVRLIPARLS